jgi:hypothetical protein
MIAIVAVGKALTPLLPPARVGFAATDSFWFGSPMARIVLAMIMGDTGLTLAKFVLAFFFQCSTKFDIGPHGRKARH